MTSPTDRSRTTPSETSQISAPQEPRSIAASVGTTSSSVVSSPLPPLTLLTVPELAPQPFPAAKLSSPTALKAKKPGKVDEKENGKMGT